MDRELEVIQDEMEQTRASLADKLGALETQVRETVSGATETVSSAVEGVKEVVGSVSETVGSVTETFNVSKHVEQHPWVAFGVAVGVGFAAAQLFSGGGSERRQEPARPPAPPPPQPAAPPRAAEHAEQPSLASQAASMLPDVSQMLPDVSKLLPDVSKLLPDVNGVMNTAISGVSGLAIGSLMNVVRGLVADAVPTEWKSEINKLVDDVNRQLGGKQVEVPRKEEPQHRSEQAAGPAQHQDQKEHGTEPTDRNRGRRAPAAV